jgi:hypothetical protein
VGGAGVETAAAAVVVEGGAEGAVEAVGAGVVMVAVVRLPIAPARNLQANRRRCAQ